MSAFLAAIATVIIAAAQPSSAVQQVDIAHDGATVSAVYSPVAAVETQTMTVELADGEREMHCRWTANIMVERAVSQAAQRLDSAYMISGIVPGACTQSETRIAAEIADRHDWIAEHVGQVARADRPVLLAQLSMSDD